MRRQVVALVAALALLGGVTGCSGARATENPCLGAGSSDPGRVNSVLLYSGTYSLVETNKPTYIHITGNIIETDKPVSKAEFTYDLDKVEPIGGSVAFLTPDKNKREVVVQKDDRKVEGRTGETIILLELCAKRKKQS